MFVYGMISALHTNAHNPAAKMNDPTQRQTKSGLFFVWNALAPAFAH